MKLIATCTQKNRCTKAAFDETCFGSHFKILAGHKPPCEFIKFRIQKTDKTELDIAIRKEIDDMTNDLQFTLAQAKNTINMLFELIKNRNEKGE